ncbi:hypothetical protein [Actinomadura sp. DC4]|uniref:hypothetical protein n=1 Tax=Actinomadura sp. DC4 TaxID=3055069 RepID=UPI0025B15012|nr:hypothetical protein [Actinomadura sp. DC4]MDN3356039.1 hypothetical protein [Actinomadura sp. DC4]
MILALLLGGALAVVLAALGAVWAGLRPPAGEQGEAGRLHHTPTCTCIREPEGAPA